MVDRDRDCANGAKSSRTSEARWNGRGTKPEKNFCPNGWFLMINNGKLLEAVD
jgi:hypothetical protein